MAATYSNKHRLAEKYIEVIREDGFNTDQNVNIGVTSGKTPKLWVASDSSVGGNFAVTGTSVFTGAVTFTASPVFSAGLIRTTASSAGTGATVVLTAADSGKVLINASTGGSPSWTLPAAANGLWYSFVCGNTTAGFTVTAAGTIHAKTTASGTAISGTTLTNTQGTAVVGDSITLVSDGTAWWPVGQSGIFAAA